MKQAEKRIIEVLLTVLDEDDVLSFMLDAQKPNNYIVNLNSSTGQSQIKEVFAKLLEIMLEQDIELEYKISEGYSKVLYKEVCKEYIEDLNREIQQVKSKIQQAM